ncbi:MAG: cryptochrome/photolyase family protein [Bacteroidia bacterium]|nr:cryptochrome/photolyase family protein [Bacteroidia bacterium]
MLSKKTLRLILGDQLNINHSWFKTVDDNITYLIMEIRTETDYAKHHVQKTVGFFAAMRSFASELERKKHKVIYIKLDDKSNLQSFDKNISDLIFKEKYNEFHYQYPDEYRVDVLLKEFCKTLKIDSKVFDTEHFLSTRTELGDFFTGKKSYLMENFYRYMRKKHNILMDGNLPVTGQWNYDKDNRKKLPSKHTCTPPLVFDNDVRDIVETIQKTNINTIGNINAKQFVWPVNRKQSLQLLDFFAEECLPLFGTYEDAMSPNEWSLYHSRLSFSMNVKLITPIEVINRSIKEWQNRPNEIEFNQLEGFVRQVIGWREYMRGIYWLKMPGFAKMNYFNHKEKLPKWYWDGDTKMKCLSHSIKQSLNYAYAHHIQRLMVTGNFALLAGVDPDETDAWYLGIYIDALDWVEITNTRGMSQFADGGIIGTKPYVSSAGYIDKMSHYCGTCFYKKDIKTGKGACPFNSLYWNFYDRHEKLLAKNPRIGMMYNVWHKMSPKSKADLLEQADYYLKNIDKL